MNVKCPNCRLVNFARAEKCARCECIFDQPKAFVAEQTVNSHPPQNLPAQIARRVAICLIVCVLTISGFYLSLIYTAAPLSAGQKQQIKQAIAILDEQGFHREAFYLKNFAVFRRGDNWFNAWMINEKAYAATNYPFEVIAVYPGFFTVPQDDAERAMILLHEAQHLRGANEKEAYEYVWKHRAQLGWTKDRYADSTLWRNVRKQTKEFTPDLFACDFNDFGDCTGNN